MSLLRKIIVFLLLVFVALAATFGYVMWRISSDVSRDPVVLNGDAEPRALVVYHPGLSDFQLRVTHAFAEGLAEVGWSVEVHTAGSKAPTLLDGYGIIALGSPTYGGAPAESVPRYLSRVGGLDGVDVAIIATGAGGPAVDAMTAMVEGEGGVVVLALGLNTMFSPSGGEVDPVEAAREAGASIAP